MPLNFADMINRTVAIEYFQHPVINTAQPTAGQNVEAIDFRKQFMPIVGLHDIREPFFGESDKKPELPVTLYTSDFASVLIA